MESFALAVAFMFAPLPDVAMVGMLGSPKFAERQGAELYFESNANRLRYAPYNIYPFHCLWRLGVLHYALGSQDVEISYRARRILRDNIDWLLWRVR